MRAIEVGRRYMPLHGLNKGQYYKMSPSTVGIDNKIPVTVLRVNDRHYNETLWEIEYTNTKGRKVKGFALDCCFGEEVK